MEDYFDITFQFDGVVYEGQVWPAEDYYQVTYHPSDHPAENRILFMEAAPVGKDWYLKKDADNPDVSSEFVCAIADEIKAQEA